MSHRNFEDIFVGQFLGPLGVFLLGLLAVGVCPIEVLGDVQNFLDVASHGGCWIFWQGTSKNAYYYLRDSKSITPILELEMPKFAKKMSSQSSKSAKMDLKWVKTPVIIDAEESVTRSKSTQRTRRRLNSSTDSTKSLKRLELQQFRQLGVPQFRRKDSQLQGMEMLGKRRRAHSFNEMLTTDRLHSIQMFLHKSNMKRTTYYNNLKSGVCVYFNEMKNKLKTLHNKVRRSRGIPEIPVSTSMENAECSTPGDYDYFPSEPRTRHRRRRGTIN